MNCAAVWSAVHNEGPQSAVSIPFPAGTTTGGGVTKMRGLSAAGVGWTGGLTVGWTDGLTGWLTGGWTGGLTGGLTGCWTTAGRRTEGPGPGPGPGTCLRAPQLHILTEGQRMFETWAASGAAFNNRRPQVGGCQISREAPPKKLTQPPAEHPIHRDPRQTLQQTK